MPKLSRETLHSLEEYSGLRDQFRREVMAHKKPRRVAITDHAILYFEDFLTMKYQVQEMLRVERIFEAEGIEDELAAYNPMIPDGSNWKATFMIEYSDVAERRVALAGLIGVEDRVWVQVGDSERVHAIADEDLERNSDDKTSAVHFMRFELTPEMVTAVQQGADIRVGVDHENLKAEITLPPDSRESLAGDLEPVH